MAGEGRGLDVKDEEMKIKIVTHGGQAHVDDLLAVAVLLAKFPKAVVQRVNEINEVEDGMVFVDIGGKFDNEKFFDHHHDQELPASIVLVLQKFYPEIDTNIPELKWISDWDTKGPIRTQKEWGVKLPEFKDPITEVVLRLFSKVTEIKPGEVLHEMLKMIGEEFIKFLKEQSELIEEAKKAKVFEVKGLKVVQLDKNVPIRIVKRVHPDVAVVIQPNQRTKGALTLTRVDDHPRVDFRRIKGRVSAHFVHSNGFMAVVDPENVNEALEFAIL